MVPKDGRIAGGGEIVRSCREYGLNAYRGTRIEFRHLICRYRAPHLPHEFQFVHAHFPAEQIAGLDLEIERLSAKLSLERFRCRIAGERYGLAPKLERALGRRLHANDALTEVGAGARNAEIACCIHRRGSCHITSYCKIRRL